MCVCAFHLAPASQSTPPPCQKDGALEVTVEGTRGLLEGGRALLLPSIRGYLVEGTGDGFKRGGEKVVKVIKDDSTGEMLKGGWMKGSCLARSRMGAG